MSTPTTALITLEGLVKRSAFTQRFNEVLGRKAPSFMSSLLAVGRSMPDVEPRSIIAAAMNAAVLDLPIDRNLGFAWIIPYRDGGQKVAQFQIGAKGFIQLALRSGCYAGMNAVAINKEVLNGYNDLGHPRFDWEKYDHTKPVAGYAFAYALSNAKDCAWTFYWSKERVMDHAQRYSQSYRSAKPSPWKTHFDQMGLKTVVKNELSDWGILSIDFQKALLMDQSVAVDVDAPLNFPDNAAGEMMNLGEGEGAPGALGEGEGAEAGRKEKRAKAVPAPTAAATEPPPPAPSTLPAGTPTLVEAPLSPQDRLANFVVHEQAANYDIFRKWAVDAGVPGAEDWTGFSDIPTKTAERIVNSPVGLAAGLMKAKMA